MNGSKVMFEPTYIVCLQSLIAQVDTVIFVRFLHSFNEMAE